MQSERAYILLFTILLSISACHSNNTKNQEDENCGKQISKSLGYINNFYFKKQTAYLDSALQILKGVENCSPKYKYIIFSDEVHAYFLKKDFASALITLDKVPDSLYPFPAFKNILELKIKAKEAETNQDRKKQVACFNALISIYRHYLDENQQTVEVVVRQSDVDAIIQSPNIDFVLSEMFFYMSKVQPMDKVISEIDAYQKKTKGNLLYFYNLKKDIKRRNGKEMSILLYYEENEW